MTRFNRLLSLVELIGLSRSAKQSLMVAVDCTLLIFAVWAAYSLRLGYFFEPNTRQFLLMLVAPLFAVPIFLRTGLYRSVIRYLGEQALWAVTKGMTLAALMWSALAFMTRMTGIEGVPRAVPILYWLIGMVLIAGVRFAARWVLWLPIRQHFTGKQVLIYGAGKAGRQLAASLRAGREMFPAGFLDDDVTLHGKDIDGLRVYAPQNLPDLRERFDIHDVIVSLSSASASTRQRIVSFLEQHKVRLRVLPAISDIANGKHLVNMVRDVDVGDLLGRDPVEADPDLLGRCITHKVVLVTGAGGSIGGELCRQIAAQSPSRLLVLDSNEHSLYQIERTLKSLTSCEVVPCLGSVRDANTVRRLLTEYAVQTIYHAAAYKHVPMVEANVFEGVANNVFGTLTLTEEALAANVETFVLISTDKAVRPTNIMGATKRWAELIVQDCANRALQFGQGPRFCAVRFGNVLGSSGSVVPLFREQIAQGGPVTVTHPEVTRYFMSVHEAVELVIQAGSLAKGGEIFLLDMGDPVKILDLARNMIRLAGYSVRNAANPDGDIQIQVTGLRPGEKLYEELLIANENAAKTPHPKIIQANEPEIDSLRLHRMLETLRASIHEQDVEELKEELMRIALNSDSLRTNKRLHQPHLVRSAIVGA
ncbi:polysaccharide biosynthesis protein [Uliginosibacterium gangwonense]|uniref:polysaccharide biosynthesis protein n=1 Tax=Uliginosibacterium gangwonense TaxID=392736 RepID=UPI00037B24E3|nr:nucleoside-diphosphate sugar epimerase/dehydratase [Uliginosibacterium gangwonense]